MLSTLLALAYGLALIVAMAGWGTAITLVLFRERGPDWWQRTAWGLAFSVAAGGPLNLAGWISPPVVLMFLGCGLVIGAVSLGRWVAGGGLWRAARRSSGLWRDFRFEAITCLLLVAFVAVLYASWVSSPSFNPHDDLQAYFVFPEKMLQTGALGSDPFSERRLVAGLGGQSFLDTFALAALPFHNLNVLDPGIALLLLAGLAAGAAWKRTNRLGGVVLVLALVSLVPPAKSNITATEVGVVLFFSLFLTLSWERLDDAHPLASAFIVALLGAGVCAVKSSFIPATAILLAVSYGAKVIRGGGARRDVLEGAAAASMIAVLLAPWMIAMLRSSGTLLYPILGKGFHGSRYGAFQPPWKELTVAGPWRLIEDALRSNLPFLAVLALAAIAAAAGLLRWRDRAPALAMTAGAIVGGAALALAVGGYAAYRYMFPFTFAAVLALLVELTPLLEASGGTGSRWRFGGMLAVLVVGGLAGGNYSQTANQLRDFGGILRGRDDQVATAAEVARYRTMQAAVPAGATLLTRLEKPFLLDFRRNRVFIVDYPGGASPPPGMPFFCGGERLADYLTAQGIRYVAYSYRNESGFRRDLFGDRLKPDANMWLRTEARHTFDFQDDLAALGGSRRRIFDDGDIFVLDLAQRGPER